MNGVKDAMKRSSKQFRLNLRKDKIQQKVWQSNEPPLQHASIIITNFNRRRKEESLESSKEGFLLIYQYQRYF